MFLDCLFFNISSLSFLFQPTRLCSAEVEVSHNLSDPLVVCVCVPAKLLVVINSTAL